MFFVGVGGVGNCKRMGCFAGNWTRESMLLPSQTYPPPTATATWQVLKQSPPSPNSSNPKHFDGVPPFSTPPPLSIPPVLALLAIVCMKDAMG